MPISLIPQSNSVSFSNGTSYSHICSLYDKYLYVASSNLIKDPYIFIYDVSDPSVPSVAGTFLSTEIAATTHGNPTCINITNGNMIIGTEGGGVENSHYYVYDLISNPLVPQYITQLDSSVPYSAISVCSNGYFYFGAFRHNANASSIIYTIQSISNPAITNSIIAGSGTTYCIGLIVKDIGGDTYLFSIENPWTVRVMKVDKSNATLSVVNTINDSLNVYLGASSYNNYIFIAGSSSIEILDISNPLSIFVASSISGTSSSAVIQNGIGLIPIKTGSTICPIYDITSLINNPSQKYDISRQPIKQLNSTYIAAHSLGIGQNYLSIDNNNYVYICYNGYLQTYYLYSSESITTATTTLPIIIANRPIQLKSVQTVLITPTAKTIATDASDNKGTLNTIDAQALSFGPLAAGETSETKIIMLNVPFANAIRNIQIGLVDTGSVAFSTNSFGIETRETLSYTVIPSTYFAGLNGGLVTSSNNISVANAGENFSQYVYINMIAPDNQAVGDGIIQLKWFFDYA